MPVLLVLALVIVPLAELAIIIQVSGAIGLTWTIVLLLFNSIAGAWLLRREGRRAWSQFHAALGEGRWPGDEVAQGGLIILGGALLLTPGFLTDLAGVLLLLPFVRNIASRSVRARVTAGVVGGPSGPRRPERRRDRRSGPEEPPGVLDVEVLEIRRDEPSDTDGPPTDR